MIALDYSLVIEATSEPDFFGFYSPEPGRLHRNRSLDLEDCIYQVGGECRSTSRCSTNTASSPARETRLPRLLFRKTRRDWFRHDLRTIPRPHLRLILLLHLQHATCRERRSGDGAHSLARSCPALSI